MPETRGVAKVRAKREGFPQSSIVCLDGDKKCYIAPHGIESSAAKRAYAECRDGGGSKEKCAKIAWAIQEKHD